MAPKCKPATSSGIQLKKQPFVSILAVGDGGVGGGEKGRHSVRHEKKKIIILL